MSIQTYNPAECIHPETMEPGKLYILPDAYEGHSAYIKTPDGRIIDQDGNTTEERDFKLLKSPERLAEKLRDSARHDNNLALFIEEHIQVQQPEIHTLSRKQAMDGEM